MFKKMFYLILFAMVFMAVQVEAAVEPVTSVVITQVDNPDGPPNFWLESITVGEYTVTVTQYSNFAVGPNLSDGFDGSNRVNFGGRSSFWAFDILGADSASGPPVVGPGSIPIPTLSEWAMWLLVVLMGLIGAGAIVRRRQGFAS